MGGGGRWGVVRGGVGAGVGWWVSGQESSCVVVPCVWSRSQRQDVACSGCWALLAGHCWALLAVTGLLRTEGHERPDEQVVGTSGAVAGGVGVSVAVVTAATWPHSSIPQNNNSLLVTTTATAAALWSAARARTLAP